MDVKILYKGCEISPERFAKQFKSFRQADKLIHLLPIQSADDKTMIKLANLVDMNFEDGILIMRFN